MPQNVDDVNIILSLVVALFLYAVGFVFVLMIKKPVRSFILKVFTAAFILRLSAVFAIYFFLVSVGGDGYVIRDDRAYNYTALEIAKDLKSHKSGFKEYASGWKNIAYFNLNGFLYHHLDFDTLTMRVLNVFFGAIVVLLIYQIMLQLFDARVARNAAILFAVLPNLIFWSASQVKDPLVILCTIFLVYIMVCKLRSGLQIPYIIAYLLTLFVLWHLRKDFCFPFIAIACIWSIFRYTFLGGYFNNQRRATLLKMLSMSVLAIPLLFGLLATQSGEKFVGTVGAFSGMQHEFSESEFVGFSRYLRVVSPLDVYKMPFAMAFTAIAPLPAYDNVINPEGHGLALYSLINTPLIFIFPLMIVGLIKFKSRNMLFTDELLVKWMPFLTWASISIIYLGVLRYKAALLAYFVMWAAVGWSYRKEYRVHIFVAYAGIAAAIFIILPIASIFR